MSPSNVVALTSGLLGLAVTVVGLHSTWSTNRRAQFDRVLSETSRLTQGDIAAARNRIGFIFESGQGRPVLSPDRINDFFTVLWAFERLSGLFRSFDGPWSRRRANAPQRLLLISCRGTISIWKEYVERGCTDDKGEVIKTAPTDLGVKELHRELNRLAAHWDPAAHVRRIG